MAMTAELRAALMLKMNAHEFLWTDAEIRRAMNRVSDDEAVGRGHREAGGG